LAEWASLFRKFGDDTTKTTTTTTTMSSYEIRHIF